MPDNNRAGLMRTLRATPVSQRALDGKRSMPSPYTTNGSLGTGKSYGHRVSLVCADCEQPLPIGDKGSECRRCKRWPVCQSCMEKHGKSCRG
jgi:hypothetical protein